MLYNAHLDTLIRVVEAGSFRQAAEQMHISPSAVLKQIGLLEKDLGVTVCDTFPIRSCSRYAGLNGPGAVTTRLWCGLRQRRSRLII